MARLTTAGAFVIFATVIFFVMVFQKFTGLKENFQQQYTLYGARANKPSGAQCFGNAECKSDICRHYTTAAGPEFTCM